MRDLIIIAIVVAGCLAALRRPWIGVMLWTWLSIMNPHRFAWGLAYSAPLAAMAAASTMLGLLLTREKESPFKASAVTIFFIFMLWITLSWLLGLDVTRDYEQWKKVMKVDVMILIALMLLRNKQHILALAWVAAGSLAILGLKGGIFTVLTGGNYRVWGPPGSFIEDNNEFALSLVMTIPLLRFLQLQLKNVWGKWAMTGTMLMCAAAAIGSYSRGAFLAIGAMAMFLWWRGKNKFGMAMILILATIPMLAFMPEAWMARMSSIGNYEEDRSSLGRISAWWTAWNIALRYPTGVGFNAARPELFAQFSPYPDFVHAAHSIYFQVMGNHGFIGLALFLAIWIATWRSAAWLRSQKNVVPEARWCADLAAMCQVSLVGYAVGGTFLSLSYFDLPYNIMVLVVLTRIWVEKRGWEREPVYAPGWLTVPGLASPPKATAPVPNAGVHKPG
ncbi:MAG TPA: putative O-glycosylation ligase, exosortase A system-associated [Burkholderiaceae bacterium]|nr:putative O-glycosylation ligase, exosortase A system-associated [Burkholderiaceae bacterium]